MTTSSAVQPSSRLQALRVFIAYRQGEDQGDAAARWLGDALDGLTLVGKNGERFKIDVYLDVRAPAMDDWRKKWRSHLAASRALLLVCTPGVATPREGQDWLHEEVRWWLKHRRTSPLLVDVDHTGETGVPQSIRAKWQYAQRVPWSLDNPLKHAESLKRITDGLMLSRQDIEYEELQRLSWRNRGIAALLAIVLGLGGLWWRSSEQEAASALAAEMERRKVYGQTVVAALQAHEGQNILGARARLDAAPTTLRGWEWDHVNYRVDQSRLTINIRAATMTDTADLSVNDLSASPDGRLLAAACSDGVIHVYELATGAPVTSLEGHAKQVRGSDTTPASVRRVAFVDNERLVSTGVDGTTRLWSVDGGSGTILDADVRLPITRDALAVLHTPQGNWVASADEEGAIDIWDVTGGGVLMRSIERDQKPVAALAFATDERLTIAKDGGIWTWDWSHSTYELSTSQSFNRMPDLRVGARDLGYSRQGGVLFGTQFGGNVWAWDTALRRMVDTGVAAVKEGLASELSVDPVEDLVLYSGNEVVQVFDRGRRRLHQFGGLTTPTNALIHVPGRQVAAAVGPIVKVWDLAADLPVRMIDAPHEQFAVSRDGRWLVTIPPTGSEGPHDIVVQDLNGESVQRSSGRGSRSVAFLPDGQTFVTGWLDGSVRQHQTLRPGTVLWTGKAPSGVTHLAVSSDGQWVATGGDNFENNTLRVWAVSQPTPVCRLEGNGPLAFSPDGKWLAAGGIAPVRDVSSASVVRIWRAPTAGDGRPAACAPGPRVKSLAEIPTERERGASIPRRLSYSPDGRHLALVTQSAVEIWDTESQTQRHLLALRPGTEPHSAVFSDDGRRLAAAMGNEVLLWNTETGHEVLSFKPAQYSTGIAWRGARLIVGMSADQIAVLGTPGAAPATQK